MNTDEVADLMLEEFPAVYPEDHSWTNIHDGKLPKFATISSLLGQLENSRHLLIHAGALQSILAPASDAPQIIGNLVLKEDIQIANLDFTSFMFVHRCGVATVWHKATSQASAGGSR
jgi:hypothetical protein